MSEVLVDVRDLRVRFRNGTDDIHAVNGVTFQLRAGEVLGILGESGSGKSVTMRALMGLLPKHKTTVSGSVTVAGKDVFSLGQRELEALRGPVVSMVFQDPMLALDPVYTVGRQITETIVKHEGVSRQEAYNRALALLDRVQIPSPKRRLEAYPHEMSGGMRQRVMIALALACRPRILLADEPTTALDATVQIQILLLLRELQREMGLAVMFVTHDIGVAAEISDQVGVMYAGRLTELGDIRSLVRTPRHPYTLGLLGSTIHGNMRGQRLDVIPGAPPDLRQLPSGCAFAPRCNRADAACTGEVPPLLALNSQHSVACHKVQGPSIT